MKIIGWLRTHGKRDKEPTAKTPRVQSVWDETVGKLHLSRRAKPIVSDLEEYHSEETPARVERKKPIISVNGCDVPGWKIPERRRRIA
jgi:hypothetical protein